MLCHGYVNAEEEEVALMFACDGALPLGVAVASQSPGSQRHRFSWRDVADIKVGPAAIFSAACSSGAAHLVGVGERLGLLTRLRSVGTRSLVAPQWDTPPEVLLPILDDALEQYLRKDGTLAQAVRAACKTAESTAPRWLAWALTTEGDWT